MMTEKEREPPLKLKDKVDGMEMDLSLCSLTSVPVKQIKPFSKVTQLDLSCNNLTALPDDFCIELTRLISVDLSKNKLMTLPDNIHLMTKLRHLDLYKNRIYSLPIGFANLTALGWLDLKDNPLEDKLSIAAGDCLDEAQCRHCAKQVVLFIRSVKADRDRQLQEERRRKREQEAARAAAAQELKDRQKLDKKIEKEKRRLQYLEQRRLQELEKENELLRQQLQDKADHDSDDEEIDVQVIDRPRSVAAFCLRMFLRLFAALMFTISILIAVHIYCDNSRKHPICIKLNSFPAFQQTDGFIHKTLNSLATWLVGDDHRS